MEKNILPEISKWYINSEGEKEHSFSYNNIQEKENIMKVLKKFAFDKPNYYICFGRDVIKLAKRCQI